MYNFIKKIDNVYAAYAIYADKLICNIGDGNSSHITFFDSSYNKINELSQTSYDFFIYNQLLFFTTQTIIDTNNKKILESYLLKLSNKQLIKLPYTLNIKGIKYEDKYICVGYKGCLELGKENYYFIIDLNTFNIEKEISRRNTESRNLKYFFGNKLFFSDSIQKLICCCDCNGKQVWQQDLKEILKYQYNKKDVYGQIKQVKQYKDSLIAVSDGGVVKLQIETGEILWKSKTYARTMEIIGNIGYVCTNHSLYKINLETGEISGYGWEYHRLPDFEYNGKKYWAVGHEVIYHDGLLWYSVYSSGHSFLLAINPSNGNYEWIHHVETNEKTASPQFHENKMFLLDTGSTLHIYEKEKR
ncbi:MAG: PQQ-binding-like beta-propeller repeat protein [Prevotellaceae bacterium]|jgi:outer membrane protein assembly factor BamB|nr:PQQ-binding-like beta-propeller repeat protein [Prevotellaceae bacterium]